MTRKINLNFMIVAAVSIFLSVVSTTLVSYQMFKQEVFADLSSFAQWLCRPDFFEQLKNSGFTDQENDLRITWIAQDGSVLYDSYRGEAKMEGHAGRPEVVRAKEKGYGASVRKSSTMGRSIFFYAQKAADGSIVRIAKEASGIWSIYRNMLPVTAAVAILSFAISVWIARYLTKALVRPIAQMADDLDHLEHVSAYKELMPFIERIRSQHEEALKNVRLRQEFTANVSHELKTPLTAISGYAELIAHGMASKKQGRHFAEEIFNNASRLLSLIDDILRLSELDAAETGGAVDENGMFQLVDICALARQCVKTMKPVAKKNGVSISFQGEPLCIRADSRLLEEMIYNLCDNAIRYNKKGGHVWVSVAGQPAVWDSGPMDVVAGQNASFGQLVIRDDGIGIADKYQKRVFERFFRVDKSRSKKTGGTGLGLAIVKHIAKVHHAEIILDSQEGAGTTVSVKFPQA